MAGPREDDLDHAKPFWYLALMGERTKGPEMAWLDPTRIYMFPKAFQACVADIADKFTDDNIDLVAGIDAAGFILGAAIALRLNVGFLTLRNAGKICVDTMATEYTNYTSRPHRMEVRKEAFPPGTRVLVFDQWMETGGTMQGGCQLIEDKGGIVAGIAAVCIEDAPGCRTICERYKHVHCTPPDFGPVLANRQDFFTNTFQMFKK